jgi:hypothetical protein
MNSGPIPGQAVKNSAGVSKFAFPDLLLNRHPEEQANERMKMRTHSSAASSGKHLVASGKAKMPSELDALPFHAIAAIIGPRNSF